MMVGIQYIEEDYFREVEDFYEPVTCEKESNKDNQSDKEAYKQRSKGWMSFFKLDEK